MGRFNSLPAPPDAALRQLVKDAISHSTNHDRKLTQIAGSGLLDKIHTLNANLASSFTGIMDNLGWSSAGNNWMSVCTPASRLLPSTLPPLDQTQSFADTAVDE